MLKNVAFTWLAMHLPKWIHQLLSIIHACRYSAGEYQNYYIIYMLARRLNKSTGELYVNHTTMCIHVQVSNQSTMSKRSRRQTLAMQTLVSTKRCRHVSLMVHTYTHCAQSSVTTLEAIPISVFPVPGGPNNRIPFGGPRKPVKISLHGKSRKHTSESFSSLRTAAVL